MRIIVFLFLSAFFGNAALGQVLSQVRPLSFGTLLIQDNSSVSSVTVPLAGPVGTTGSILLLSPGQTGQFMMTGLPADTTVDLMITAEPLFGETFQRSHTYFRIGQFFAPMTIVTDGDGEATFDLGAQLDTSGNGFNYAEDTYSGNVTITVILP